MAIRNDVCMVLFLPFVCMMPIHCAEAIRLRPLGIKDFGPLSQPETERRYSHFIHLKK
jgi:hypothetical protein